MLRIGVAEILLFQNLNLSQLNATSLAIRGFEGHGGANGEEHG